MVQAKSNITHKLNQICKEINENEYILSLFKQTRHMLSIPKKPKIFIGCLPCTAEILEKEPQKLNNLLAMNIEEAIALKHDNLKGEDDQNIK
jgi:hypothetical protein